MALKTPAARSTVRRLLRGRPAAHVPNRRNAHLPPPQGTGAFWIEAPRGRGYTMYVSGPATYSYTGGEGMSPEAALADLRYRGLGSRQWQTGELQVEDVEIIRRPTTDDE